LFLVLLYDMSLLFHRKSNGSKGVRSDAERERAVAQVTFFRAALDKVRGRKPTRRNAEVVAKCESVLRDREAEISDYDALKRGELNLPKLRRLDDVAAFIPRIRIARGVSQTELARRLGVSKQVISRYEESGYQSVGLARLQQILDALGTKTEIDLSSNS
jgi:ribosome-binding protein aMBF1 (putative translation factor)